MTLENYETKGVKTQEEVHEFIDLLSDKIISKIEEKIDYRKRVSEDDTEGLSEEIKEIIKLHVSMSACLGLAHNCNSDSDDAYFYASILEHRDWKSFTQRGDVFAYQRDRGTAVMAQEALTAVYSAVKPRVFRYLREEVKKAKEN